MTVEIPWDRLVENTHDWNLVSSTINAGQTTSASIDVNTSGGGLWVAKLNNIRFANASDTRLWRALRQIASGSVVPLVVPRRDTTWAPFPQSVYGSISYGDGAYFSDGSGYYQSVIDITSVGSAALRATSLVVRLNYSAPLQGGECFSINHPTYGWRLYEIATAIDNGNGTTTIAFNPPLREAATNGTQLEFDRPRCTMKLFNSSAMDLTNSTYPFSLASATFIESKYS